MAVKKPPGELVSNEYDTLMRSLSDEDYIAAKLKEIDKAPDPGVHFKVRADWIRPTHPDRLGDKTWDEGRDETTA